MITVQYTVYSQKHVEFARKKDTVMFCVLCPLFLFLLLYLSVSTLSEDSVSSL